MELLIDTLEKLKVNDENVYIDESQKEVNLEVNLVKDTEGQVDEPVTKVTDQHDSQKSEIQEIQSQFDAVDTLDTQFEEHIVCSSDNESWSSYCKLLNPIHDEFGTKFNWDSNSEGETNSGINFENIFEDIGNLSRIEKQLDLLYRPFTCAMDAHCRFNLCELCLLITDSRFEPGCHPSVSIRVRYPVAMVKVYEGGKMISSALTADGARTALLNVIQMVQALDMKAEIHIFRHNIVNASFCMPFKVDLEMLAELHSEQSSYNIKKRPFLTYSIEGTDIRFVVFASGYVMVLHSSKHSETRAAIAGFLPILSDFKSGLPTAVEKTGLVFGDITYKLLWERKLEDDKDGLLLYD